MNTFLSIGSGPGMSYATAERFAREDFQIVLSARNAAKTGELAQRLGSKGHEVVARSVDSGDPKSVASLIASVERDFGAVDVLHYNAASIRKAGVIDQPTETFVPDLAVNVGGALMATQAVLQRMIERRSGTILLTGGGNSVAPTPDYLSLSIGKAGIRAMTFGLFESLRTRGIHIATVTVSAIVVPDSRESLAIAEHFWKLHAQPPGAWTAEVKFSG